MTSASTGPGDDGVTLRGDASLNYGSKRPCSSSMVCLSSKAEAYGIYPTPTTPTPRWTSATP